MSALNAYVNTNSFKLEGWEEMFEMSKDATCGIKFDLKNFYHEIDLAPKEYKYYGFQFPYGQGVQALEAVADAQCPRPTSFQTREN